MFPNTHKGAMTRPLVYMKNPALRGICFFELKHLHRNAAAFDARTQ